MEACHICGNGQVEIRNPGFESFDCPRCGWWSALPGKQGKRLRDWLGDWEVASVRRRSRLSHILRRQQREPPVVANAPLDGLDTWGLDDPLPSLAQQADDLVRWIAARQPSYDDLLILDSAAASAWIGAPIQKSNPGAPIAWLLNSPRVKELITVHPQMGGPYGVNLTFDGWARYEVLRNSIVESHDAFMAMKFDDAELNMVVDHWFKPAALRAGFNLRRVTDGQPAGLIDDQMRVAIRTSKFVVADLTHASNGAYWEAGFGEGLGRPVIYTCRNDVWKDRKSHFDTAHLATIDWDPNDLSAASARLTNMIRATLPAEAKMTSDLQADAGHQAVS